MMKRIPKPVVALSRQLLILGVAACLSAPAWAANGSIQAIQLDPSTHRLSVQASGPVSAVVNTLTISGQKRIIIDIENATIGYELPRDIDLLSALNRQWPAVRNVSVNQFNGQGRSIVRILLDVAGDVGTAQLLTAQGSRLELQLGVPLSVTASAQPAPRVAPAPQPIAQPTVAAPALDQAAVVDDLKRQMRLLSDAHAAELKQLRQANAELQARLEAMTKQPSGPSPEQQAEIQKLQATIVEMDSRYKRLAEESDSLKQQLNARPVQPPADPAQVAEITKLRQMNVSLQDQLAKLLADRESVSQLKEELARLQKEHDALKQQAAKPSDTAEADRLRQANQSLQDELIKAYKDQDALKAKLGAQQVSAAEKAGLEAQLAAVKAELAALRQENARLSSQPAPAIDASLQAQLQQLQEENARLKASPSSGTPANSTAGELDELRAQLDMAQESLNRSIQTINEQNKEIAYLRRQVQDVQQGFSKGAREQITALEAEVSELKKQLAAAPAAKPTVSAKDDTATLKKQLDQLTLKYKTTVDDLTAQLQAARNQAELAEKQAESLELELAETRKNLEQARSQQSGQRDKLLAEKDGTIRGLQQELASLKEETEGLRQELLQVRNAQPPALDLSQYVAKAEYDKLQIELAGVSKVSQRVQALEKELDDARKALESERKKAAKKPAQSDPALELKTQIAELTRQLEEVQKDNASLREQLAAASVKPSTASIPALATDVPDAAVREFDKAKQLMGKGDLKKAIDAYAEAFRLDPRNSQYVYEYSIALGEDQQYDKAIGVLVGYLQKNPGDRQAYHQLGKLYLLSDQPQAASQALSRALPVSTLNNYATSLKKLNKLNEAEQVYKLALTLSPNDTEVLFNLGTLYNAANRLDEAKSSYVQALKVKPDFAEAHYNLGLLFSKLGNRAEAINHLEQFLKLAPNARNAESIRAYVQKLKV